MEQLGIKHLGRRLAYGLKFYIDKDSSYPTMLGIDQFNRVILSEYTYKTPNSDSIFTRPIIHSEFNNPILRDLSCLTKEITHNGEKFIPLVELAKLNFGSNFISLEKVFSNDNPFIKFLGRGDSGGDDHQYTFGSVFFGLNKQSFSFYSHEPTDDCVTHCDTIWQYKLIEWLLEHHFHLDEPEGTWIDVNTLPKNPYE